MCGEDVLSDVVIGRVNHAISNLDAYAYAHPSSKRQRVISLYSYEVILPFLHTHASIMITCTCKVPISKAWGKGVSFSFPWFGEASGCRYG